LHYPFLRRGLGAFAKTSLADGTDLDGSEAETKTDKKQGHATFLTALSWRGLEGGAMKRFHIALEVSGMKISPPSVM
jgi:hypothetical protein